MMIEYDKTWLDRTGDFVRGVFNHKVIPLLAGLLLIPGLCTDPQNIDSMIEYENFLSAQSELHIEDDRRGDTEQASFNNPQNPIILTIPSSGESAEIRNYLINELKERGIPLNIEVAPSEAGGLERLTWEEDLCLNLSTENIENSEVYFTKLQGELFKKYNERLVTGIDLDSLGQEVDLRNLRQAGIKIGFTSNHRVEYSIGDYNFLTIQTDEKIDEESNLQEILRQNTTQEINPLAMEINLDEIKSEQEADTLVRNLENILAHGAKVITPKEFYYDFAGLPQYVIIRSDDYQSGWGRDRFEIVTNSISELQIPQTIAIIPGRDGGISTNLDARNYLEFMRRNGQIEFALHGLDHDEIMEFNQPQEFQEAILRKGLDEMAKVTEDEIEILIPPYNQINEQTSDAITRINNERGSNIGIVSAITPTDRNVLGFDEDHIYHLSRVIDPVRDWRTLEHLATEEVLGKIGNDDGVLMIHPLIYETESQQQNLVEIIKTLQENPRINFVTMSEFVDEVSQPLGYYQTAAETAWEYFKDSLNTANGLHYPNYELNGNNLTDPYNIITPWDLGSTILGINSASELGLIDEKETIERLTPILNFLNENELYDNILPNNNYRISDGGLVNMGERGSNSSDLGRILISLNKIKTNHPELENLCNSIVERWELPVENNIPQGTRPEGRFSEINTYSPYFSNGFRLWGEEVDSLGGLRFGYNQEQQIYTPRPTRDSPTGFNLIPEPFLLQALEIGFNGNPILEEILKRSCELQEERFRETGIYTAISEGSIDKSPWFLYPGILDESGNLFPVSRQMIPSGEDYANLRFFHPKAAIAMDCLYNTPYTNTLRRIAMENNMHEGVGFTNGIYESTGELNRAIELNTQAEILEAIAYRQRMRVKSSED